MANKTLHSAKAQKNDEYYTQLSDINNELKHYRNQLKDKVVFCNCDDPYESNFFRYFALNFNKLGLKQLITTSYKPSPIANTQLGLFGDDKTVESPKGRPKATANKFIINEVGDIDGDGAFDLQDIAEQLKANKNNEWTALEGNGDFRSPECVKLLKKADVVVTNPPFSLFREYVAQLVEHNKKFLLIGNKNTITYKEIYQLIQDDKLWVGTMPMGRDLLFNVPDEYAKRMVETGKVGSKYKIVNDVIYGRSPSIWFTNMDNPKRHEQLPLYKKYILDLYPKYDNYDAIEVGKVADIPANYLEPMGVPITFLDKYNPEQFEIIRFRKGNDEKDLLIDGKSPYFRILIKRKVKQ